MGVIVAIFLTGISLKFSQTLPDFTLRISLQIGTAHDKWNYMATNPSALDALDSLDIPNPPPGPGMFNPLSFFVGGTLLAADVKRTFTNGESKIWNLQLTYTAPGTIMKLYWPMNQLPSDSDASYGMMQIYEGLSFTLFDMATHTTINMRDTGEYQFVYTGMRTFQIIVDGQWLGLKSRDENQLGIINIVPNPACEFVSIEIPYTPEGIDKISIVDIAGKTIKTLSPGSSKIMWDCRDEDMKKVLPGIYFLKIFVRNKFIVRKLVVIY